jgi:hypothetical protein
LIFLLTSYLWPSKRPKLPKNGSRNTRIDEVIRKYQKQMDNLFLKGPSLENLWERYNHLFLVLGGTIIFHLEVKMTLDLNKSREKPHKIKVL